MECRADLRNHTDQHESLYTTRETRKWRMKARRLTLFPRELVAPHQVLSGSKINGAGHLSVIFTTIDRSSPNGNLYSSPNLQLRIFFSETTR